MSPLHAHKRTSTCCEPGVHQLNHLFDRESVRPHGRLGAAIGATGEQFERAAAGGGQANLTATRWHERPLMAKGYSHPPPLRALLLLHGGDAQQAMGMS